MSSILRLYLKKSLNRGADFLPATLYLYLSLYLDYIPIHLPVQVNCISFEVVLLQSYLLRLEARLGTGAPELADLLLLDALIG